MGKLENRDLTPEAKDVVVAGAGGSGLAAALTLAEGGAKVVIFEKMPFAGGSFLFVEGTFAADSDMQRKRNIKVTRDEAFRGIMEYSHWKANAALVRAFVDKSASTIDWLEKQGVEFTEPTGVLLGGPRTWHLFKGLGGVAINVLVANAVKKGVEVRYETTVKHLLREGNGPVAGAVVEDKTGKQIKVQAKGVIIATGGYPNNKEWIKKYSGFDLEVTLFLLGRCNKTGEGIQMAWEAGAAEEGVGVIHLNIGSPPKIGARSHIWGAVGQPTLWVNRDGVRFCDETIVENIAYAGNAMAKQKGGYVFRIFDEETKIQLAENGGIGVGMYVPSRTPLTYLDTKIKAAVEEKNPFIFVADTLDELANKMGIDRAIFKKTVEEYNRFCEKGHDDQFAKDPEYLRPVKTPRFYAFKCYMNFLGTLGGIKINEKTEVLDKDDEVIPGLYAVGNDAGGLYGDSYDVIASGASSGFALNSGRISGENALKYIRR
jgi:fumarate reductase flavoprotein subunit